MTRKTPNIDACAGQAQRKLLENRIVFFGGPIHTLAGDGTGRLAGPDAGRGEAVEAVGVWGDRITAVGTRREVEAALTTGDGRRPRPVDLRGAALLPGLVDAHTHLGSFGLRLSLVDLEGVASLERVGALVAAAAAGLPAGRWVRGGGWNKNLWPGGRFPSRHDLDRVAPHHPVALSSKDGHTLWLNSEALRLAGVTAETPDPPGGEIERDTDGVPTGILKENAMEFGYRSMDQPSAEDYAACMERAQAEVHRLGLVGVHDMEGRESFRALESLELAGRLNLRVWMYVPHEFIDGLDQFGVQGNFGTACLKIAGLKAFLDGALGSHTADMLEPYEGSDNRGIETMTAEAFETLVARATAARLPVAVHAIGDRANRKALDAFELHREAARAAGVRHRIEHVQLLHPRDVPRLGSLEVVASMQPIHAPSDRDVADALWGERARTGYAWRSVAAHGAALAFGSDVPVESANPLHGLYAAATRRHPQAPEREPWHPEEAVGIRQAVWAYTVGAAYAVRAETERGTIEPGKLADLVVLGDDILAPDVIAGRPGAAEVLLRTRVVATMVGGSFVHGEL